jgi:hypothetical protein
MYMQPVLSLNFMISASGARGFSVDLRRHRCSAFLFSQGCGRKVPINWNIIIMSDIMSESSSLTEVINVFSYCFWFGLHPNIDMEFTSATLRIIVITGSCQFD